MSALDHVTQEQWDSIRYQNIKDRYHTESKPGQEMNDYIAERAKKVKKAHDDYHVWLKAWKENKQASEDTRVSEDETEDMYEDEPTKEFNDHECAQNVGNIIDKPAHYNNGEIEAIDYIKQQTGDGFRDYLYGNAMKYMHRHRYKGKPVEDLRKAAWYINRMIQEEVNNGF